MCGCRGFVDMTKTYGEPISLNSTIHCCSVGRILAGTPHLRLDASFKLSDSSSYSSTISIVLPVLATLCSHVEELCGYVLLGLKTDAFLWWLYTQSRTHITLGVLLRLFKMFIKHRLIWATAVFLCSLPENCLRCTRLRSYCSL